MSDRELSHEARWLPFLILSELPFCTLQELAAGPRKNCNSEYWVTKQKMYSHQNWRDIP